MRRTLATGKDTLTRALRQFLLRLVVFLPDP